MTDVLLFLNYQFDYGRPMTFREGATTASAPLPEGGGAQSPMGEAFEVDLATGSGSYRLPFQLPPGPRQLKVDLALSYGTGHGNGLP